MSQQNSCFNRGHLGLRQNVGGRKNTKSKGVSSFVLYFFGCVSFSDLRRVVTSLIVVFQIHGTENGP